MYNFQDYSALYNNNMRPFYVRVGILLTCGKHVYGSIISLREEVWAHKISLSPTLFIEVPVSKARK